MASKERLSEELQHLAKSNEHLATVMEELTDEENAPEDQPFFIFRRSISSDAAHASTTKATNPISGASDVSAVPIIEESFNEAAHQESSHEE